MSLEAVYMASQIAASVAVLASLIYLALQTRQTARNQQAQMHAMRLQVIREDVRLIGDPAFFPVYTACMAGEPGVNAADANQFMMFAYSLMLNFQEQYYEFQEGMINRQRWEPSRLTMRRLLSSPGFRSAFQLYRPTLDVSFAALGDSLIAEARTVSAPTPGFERWQQLVAAERGGDRTGAA